MRLYLAGPDVFHPDAVGIGERKKALCTRYGFVGLYPCDDGSPDDPGAVIYANCLAKMREADGGLFNLTPFRGPSADAGTLVELGFMAASSKPVFAYTNAGGDLVDRLHVAPGLVRAGSLWRDPDGMIAEDFGNADNLMVDETLVAQGRRIHRVAVELTHRFIDLVGFEACLVEARSTFGI